MTVREVTGFSNEYGLLDSGLIAFVRERFPGAQCTITRKGAQQQVDVTELLPFDALQAILVAQGSGSLDAPTVETLLKRGMKEFIVVGAPALQPEAPPSAPVHAAAVVARDGAMHQQRVSAARQFVEQLGQADEQREQASLRVQDLFNQGRAGKYTQKPAMAAVEEIISHGLSGAMTALAGLKGSDQTYAHCVDMAVIFQETYTDILRQQGQEINSHLTNQTLLAGFCHDIGKSTVPQEVLDSTQRFERDSPEMALMRGHAAAGAQILTDLGLHKTTVNVAHYHHVKIDTSHAASYPEANWEDVLPATRLAAVVDVYQALIGKRSYKKNWVPAKAVEYLNGLRGKEFDPLMLDKFLHVIGLYPIGSLLRLSTGDLGFVLAIGIDEPERPVVAVVENARGELLSEHTLIDLMEERDIAVQEIVDHYEHYSASEDQSFRIFSSLKVA